MNPSGARQPSPTLTNLERFIYRANLINRARLTLPGKSLGSSGKVAKKLALYPPKKIMLQLGLDEGQRVKYTVEKGKLVVEPLPNPIDLALKSEKWSSTTVKKFEREAELEQEELYG